MAAPRFYVDSELISGTRNALPERVAHHAQHALRLHDGDDITLFNGRGGEYAAKLIAGRAAFADVGAFDPVERESALNLTLIQAWIAIEKIEWVVEKAVELGVAHIVLAPTARSVIKLDGERLAKRIERLRDIVIAACCQCGRNRVPRLEAASSLDDAFANTIKAQPTALRWLLHPDAKQSGLANEKTSAAIVAVGAEGGFTAEEIDTAKRQGFVQAVLGPRVLRSETAGLAALAALQAQRGDFTPSH